MNKEKLLSILEMGEPQVGLCEKANPNCFDLYLDWKKMINHRVGLFSYSQTTTF